MSRKQFLRIAILIWMAGWIAHPDTMSCTNFLITKGASVNGSNMITYAADSHILYGELYYTPAQNHSPGERLDIYEWDSGKYLGHIRQAEKTCSVTGNMNEFQVAIGETTYGGREELVDSTGIMDYGSLMYVALQRAGSAREAIKIMAELVDEYGYCSSGESFSIMDKNEVWIMEMIGKGPGNKGAVWVARKVPDGYICAHANQARIRRFPLADGKTSISSVELNKIFDTDVETVYARDVITVARKRGYFSGKDSEFSFSDTYAPVDFGGARFCEIRVWSMFRNVKDGMDQYLDYVRGDNLRNRMPLWIKPDRKISLREVMDFMRDHLEGTKFDMTEDIGGGPFERPYRWRPLTWEVNGETYCNERAAATQQTGFSFVAQARSWLPDWIGGIFWFGVDDAATSVYTPMYCGINAVPECFRESNGDMITYSPTSAFWLFNRVSNFCYLRYNLMVPDVKALQKQLEGKYIALIPAIDKAAADLYEKNKPASRDFLTQFSISMGNHTFNAWEKLSEFLLVKYIDGNVKKEEDGKFLYNEYGSDIPQFPGQPGYPEWWYEEIIEETEDHFKVKGKAH